MKRRQKILSITGILIFLIGIFMGLVLSGWYVWGEAEAALMVSRTGDVTITSLRCPLMLGSTETGLVSAYFNDPTSAVIRPTVQAQISHGTLPRLEKTILTLAPGEMKQLQWQIGPEDRIFRWLILVNVYETSQPDFLSQQGSCGILFSSIPGVSGKVLSILISVMSLLGMIIGLALWTSANTPLRDLVQNATNAMSVLAVIVVLSMLLILPRWWVLSGFFFLAAIMLIGIIITQFVLFPGSGDRGRAFPRNSSRP